MKPQYALIFFLCALLCGGCKDKQAEACFHVNELRSNDPYFKFEFTSCSPGAEWFEWDFGDSSFSTKVNTEHVYGKKGIFPVTLVAYEGAETTEFTREIEIGDYGLFDYSIEDYKLRFELFEDSNSNCEPDPDQIFLRLDYAYFIADSLPLYHWNHKPYVDVIVRYDCPDGTKKEYALISEVPFNLNKILDYKEVDFIDKWTGSKVVMNILFDILPEPEPLDTLVTDTLSAFGKRSVFPHP